jgi:hypothetical protein
VGEFEIEFIHASFDLEGNWGELFMEFKSKVWEHKLLQNLQRLGARQVTIHTFGGEDGLMSAASALNRIKISTQHPDRIAVIIGTCNFKVESMASVLLEKKTNECCDECGCAIKRKTTLISYSEEFDVKENLKTIQKKYDYVDNCVDKSMGGVEFKDNGLFHIMDNVLDADRGIMKDEISWISSQKGGAIRHGYVYAAYNPCFRGFVKIGATAKENPYERIKSLSGCNVPVPFEMVMCVPSKDPFKLEKEIHLHFKEKRVLKENRLTEFFEVEKDEVISYMSGIVEKMMVVDAKSEKRVRID